MISSEKSSLQEYNDRLNNALDTSFLLVVTSAAAGFSVNKLSQAFAFKPPYVSSYVLPLVTTSLSTIGLAYIYNKMVKHKYPVSKSEGIKEDKTKDLQAQDSSDDQGFERLKTDKRKLTQERFSGYFGHLFAGSLVLGVIAGFGTFK